MRDRRTSCMAALPAVMLCEIRQALRGLQPGICGRGLQPLTLVLPFCLDLLDLYCTLLGGMLQEQLLRNASLAWSSVPPSPGKATFLSNDATKRPSAKHRPLTMDRCWNPTQALPLCLHGAAERLAGLRLSSPLDLCDTTGIIVAAWQSDGGCFKYAMIG